MELEGTAAPSVPAQPLVQAHGVTTNAGDFNLAGRDLTVHTHYYTHASPRIDLRTVLRTVRNLRRVHLAILSKVTTGTGGWLLKMYRFLLWVDPKGDLRILWGSGIPGAGKTYLASIVIRELEARAAAAGNICVAYMYIRYSDSTDLTVRDVFEVLVKQTIERHQDCASLAEPIYHRHIQEDTLPIEDELLQLLRQFVETKAVTFYVIDALDEAPDRVQLELVKKLASLNVKLFITSRPLSGIAMRFPDAHCFSIVAQDGDLDCHILQEIERSPDLQDLMEKAGPLLKYELMSSIRNNCRGMFLHASLQLSALAQCASVHDLRETLATFPSKIEDVYLQTWARINENPKRRSLVKTVLLWVLYASRPTTLEELEFAVATSPTTFRFDPGQVVSGATLIAACRGLVVLEEESRVVRLVHYTAKDSLHGLLHYSAIEAHALIATICMTHLSKHAFQNTHIGSENALREALKADPLLAYAHDAWHVHVRESLESLDIKGRASKFVIESKAFPAFLNYHRSVVFDIISHLHIVALYDLPLALVVGYQTEDPNLSTQITQSSPLMLTSLHGHTGIAEDLLSLPNILINTVNEDGWPALMLAARTGYERIVGMLLSRPEVAVNLVDADGWSPLMGAARAGYKGTTRLLLSHPDTLVNYVSDKGTSALMLAASHGFDAVVTVFLEHPSTQLNLVDSNGWSALMRAAQNGHEDTVAAFLARSDILVNLANAQGITALMAAAAGGHDGAFARLLAHPDIEVNARSHKGSSALDFAARGGHAGIIILLIIYRGVEMNGSPGGSPPLVDAVLEGHSQVVKLLLSVSDIEVNAADEDGDTAVKLAAEYGHEDIVRMLLNAPQINTALASQRDGYTALSVAIARGHTVIAQLIEAYQSQGIVPSTSPDTFQVEWNSEQMIHTMLAIGSTRYQTFIA